jgi:hypothetical protein
MHWIVTHSDGTEETVESIFGSFGLQDLAGKTTSDVVEVRPEGLASRADLERRILDLEMQEERRERFDDPELSPEDLSEIALHADRARRGACKVHRRRRECLAAIHDKVKDMLRRWP